MNLRHPARLSRRLSGFAATKEARSRLHRHWVPSVGCNSGISVKFLMTSSFNYLPLPNSLDRLSGLAARPLGKYWGSLVNANDKIAMNAF